MQRTCLWMMVLAALLMGAAQATYSQEINWQRQMQGILDGVYLALWHGGAEYTKPTLVDIDGDGDGDLFVGEHDGYLNFFRNLGGNPPNWQCVSTALDTIDVDKQCAPAFWDIDLDGDKDMFLGKESGTISFYRNEGSELMPYWTLEDTAWMGIDVGYHSTPTFRDMDANGLDDIVIGKNDSCLSFYHNEGAPGNPVFVLADTVYQNIAFDQKTTVFAQDLNWDNLPDLLVSSEDGAIYFYENEGPAQNPTFADPVQCAAVNHNGAPALWDLNGDGLLDLVSGEATGNLNYWINTGTHTQPRFQLSEEYLAYFDIGKLTMPTLVDIDADSDLDLFIGRHPQGIYFLENVGTLDSAVWHLADTFYNNIALEPPIAPTFCDLDDDNDPDLMLGGFNGTLSYYQNIGTPQSPQWATPVHNYASIDVGFNSAPTFTDLNGDGKFDLFVGGQSLNGRGVLRYLLNIGTQTSPTWLDMGNTPLSDSTVTAWNTYLTPSFYDLNDDGQLDLIAGNGSNAGTVKYYQNIGTPLAPFWSLVTPIYRGWDFGDRSAPCFGDLNGDGEMDLVVGCLSGGLYYFQHGGAWYNVILSLIPQNPPIYIPVQGGNVEYFMSLHNYEPSTQFITYWTSLTLPGGQVISPLDSFSTAMPPQTVLDIMLMQMITDTLPQGVYTLTAYVGNYPNNPYSSDNFPFQKVSDSLAVKGTSPGITVWDFRLGAPHPNPFNGTTLIEYSLPSANWVQATVYDITGRRVMDLSQGWQAPGRHSLTVNLDPWASGIYFLHLRAGKWSATQKLCYIR